MSAGENQAGASAPENPAQKRQYDSTARPLWEILVEIGEQIPDEELAKLPKDFAANKNHYLYGAPKE